LDDTLAFAGFNIPRLERFCATNFWDTNAGTSFLVPDHVLQLIVDHLRLTGVIKETFASTVIKVEEMVSCTVLLYAKAFSGYEIPSFKFIVAVLHFPSARTIIRLAFLPPVKLARETGIFAWCQITVNYSYQMLRTDLGQ